MSRYLLDTGLIIRHVRGHRPSVHLMRELSRRDRLSIATITRVEVYAGMKPGEEFITRKLLSRMINIGLGARIADRAGDLLFSAKKMGKPMQLPDAIIAATARLNNLTLVTYNVSDFANISGLRMYPIS